MTKTKDRMRRQGDHGVGTSKQLARIWDGSVESQRTRID